MRMSQVMEKEPSATLPIILQDQKENEMTGISEWEPNRKQPLDHVPACICKECGAKFLEGEGVVVKTHGKTNDFCSEECASEFTLKNLRRAGL